MSDWIQIRKARTLLKGCPGPQGPPGPTLYQGNVAVVDSIYGNDSTSSMSGSPYKTIERALSQVAYGQTVYILPGTYTLTHSIQLHDGISMIGMPNTFLVMHSDVSVNMITMGEDCLIDGLNIRLNGSGTNPIVLKGIVFDGTSSQTSNISNVILTLDNRTMNLSSNVIGIEFSGEGDLTSSTFSFNSIKSSTINIYSNGSGIKRGILVSGTNQVSTRDTNIFVAEPLDSISTGSYVGVETNNIDQLGSIQLRTTTVSVHFPAITDSYSASDILQTTPDTISDPTYLASPGIQIGPGTDLVTKSAGGKGFSTYIYPTIIYYGLKGVTNTKKTGYLWPGSQLFSNDFPDDDGVSNNKLAAYFRVQQPSLISGLSCSTNNQDEVGFYVILSIKVTPLDMSMVDTSFSVTLTHAQLDSTFYDSSFRCGTGDRIHLFLDFSGNTETNDITAQIDLF